jgi:hypothetical protein
MNLKTKQKKVIRIKQGELYKRKFTGKVVVVDNQNRVIETRYEENGFLHNENGPAVFLDGDKVEYWINGIQYQQVSMNEIRILFRYKPKESDLDWIIFLDLNDHKVKHIPNINGLIIF